MEEYYTGLIEAKRIAAELQNLLEAIRQLPTLADPEILHLLESTIAGFQPPEGFSCYAFTTQTECPSLLADAWLWAKATDEGFVVCAYARVIGRWYETPFGRIFQTPGGGVFVTNSEQPSGLVTPIAY